MQRNHNEICRQSNGCPFCQCFVHVLATLTFSFVYRYLRRICVHILIFSLDKTFQGLTHSFRCPWRTSYHDIFCFSKLSDHMPTYLLPSFTSLFSSFLAILSHVSLRVMYLQNKIFRVMALTKFIDSGTGACKCINIKYIPSVPDDEALPTLKYAKRLLVPCTLRVFSERQSCSHTGTYSSTYPGPQSACGFYAYGGLG